MRLLPAVEAALRAQNRPFRVTETMSMQHARELAREAREKQEIVAAMGGDGITGAIAGELRDSEGVLAVLPGGRGNDFARKLGIPFDPAEAVKLLLEGEERRGGPPGAPRRGLPGAPSGGGGPPPPPG